jgi:hypothetical protein
VVRRPCGRGGTARIPYAGQRFGRELAVERENRRIVAKPDEQVAAARVARLSQRFGRPPPVDAVERRVRGQPQEQIVQPLVGRLGDPAQGAAVVRWRQPDLSLPVRRRAGPHRQDADRPPARAIVEPTPCGQAGQ